MRSFGLVEDKVYEADFFLEKIKDCIDPKECNYYFSAFLSASRSITFSLQACMSDIKGFKEWYEEKQVILKRDKIARKFVEMRNVTQKIGEHFITSGNYYTDDNGNLRGKFYFQDEMNSYCIGENPREIILKRVLSGELFTHQEEDVATQCDKNFIMLIEIIFESFQKFGSTIDPEKYYTLENLELLGLSIEDIETTLGFPKGYTNVEGISNEDRIKFLRESEPSSEIDYIFMKYLNKARYRE
ncbi:hypothetical protein [Paenibacillus sp. P22]|uniref:hypothetical protein n=1 Tax=Paenibacillus sp. P22 TaxID=483908 RepID=UPI00043341DA|nr:hypothetical protein [Paenibacillus sp. P22]CDN42957.1 Uncharacterized protein BN871_CF_00220 [Paenibacillus sp. P22]